MAITSESTTFTKDIQGRYLCNTYGEATAGGPFDIVVIGGGTFGAAIAEHVWYRQKRAGGGVRTIVLDAGPFTLPEHVQNTGILGLFDPADVVILNENAPQPEPARNEVWVCRGSRPRRSKGWPTVSAGDRSTGADGRRACSTRKCRPGRPRSWPI